MTGFKLKICAGVSPWVLAAAFGLCASGAATAQSVQPDPARASDVGATNVGAVVVTARRAVDTPAGQIKRANTGVTDTITATTIERTADVSLPEALARLPGVSADAFYGTADAGYVSLRGFDSRYNSMDVDGNPIWFSSQNNRGAQIGLFPASIVKETTVYKTVTPDQDGNSIGGHISLRTLRAFDGGGGSYARLGGRIGGYEQEGEVDPGASGRLYGAAKTTFGPQDRFGAVLGFNVQRYRNADLYGGVDAYVQVDGNDLVQANIYQNSQYDKDVTNTALYGKLEWQDADRLYAFVSGSLYDESRVQYLQRTATYVYQSQGRTTGFQDGRANFTGGQGQTREYDYDFDRNARVFGAGLDLRVADKSSIALRAGYTEFGNEILTRYPDAFILTGLAGSYDLNGDRPTIQHADPARYNDPANWRFRNTTNSYRRYQTLDDEVFSLTGVFNYNNHQVAEGLGFSVGTGWTRLDRRYDQNQDNYRLPTGTTLLLSQIAPSGSSMANNQAVKMDWDAFWRVVQSQGILTTDTSPTTDYGLLEDVSAAHAALNYRRGGLHLLAGLRYEHTDYSADTADLRGQITAPVKRGNSYANWLPNFQATYDFTSQLRLRAAFTKTIGRADFADFAPGQTTSFNANGVPVVSGVNPLLGPRVSTNYDLSLEHYSTAGLVSLAVFRKELAHETFDQRTETFDAAGMLTLIETIPLNTGSAEVNGVEASFSRRRLDFLPEPLARFGLAANATYLDGAWNVVFTDGSTRSVGGLRNQPKWLGNLVVSYDAGPLDLTLAYTVRGRTFTGTFGTTEVGDRWIDGYDSLNAQAALAVSDKLRLTLEARNLTDSYIRQTTGLTDAVYNAVGSGRSYFAGFRYTY